MHICAWQSADSRVTTDHCRVTLRWVFTKSFLIAWNVQKRCLTVGPTVAWPPTTVAWPFSDFFQNFPKSLKTSKKRCLTVVWQSADGRGTSDHCRVTVQRLFSKKFLIAWNVEKSLFDSRLTVGWPPTTVTWPFSDFFQKNSNCLKRRKIVVWQSADGRVTSDHSRTASHTASQMYISLFFFFYLSAKSKATYLLLQEWSDPGNFDIISKLGIGRREFLILAGKFQLVDSPWGEQVPHYKHRRRSITYLLREIPVKNRERCGRSQQTGKLSGKFFCLIFASSSAIRRTNAT